MQFVQKPILSAEPKPPEITPGNRPTGSLLLKIPGLNYNGFTHKVKCLPPLAVLRVPVMLPSAAFSFDLYHPSACKKQGISRRMLSKNT